MSTQFGNEPLLLVGMDCWGHSLAARLGYELQLRSVGLSVRGLTDEEFHTELQRRALLRTGGSGYTRFCYITDVIATGGTVRRVKAALSGIPNSKHYSLSLIRSKYSHQSNSMSGLEVYSVLDHFAIPILKDDELPLDLLVPAKTFGLH